VATIKLQSDEEVAAVPAEKAVFDEIRAVRKSEFVNNFWRALANQPRLLERTWADLKQVPDLRSEDKIQPASYFYLVIIKVVSLGRRYVGYVTFQLAHWYARAASICVSNRPLHELKN